MKNTGIDTKGLHGHIHLSLIIKNTLLTGNNCARASSVGLKVGSLSCSICGKEYGSCKHLLGVEYPREGVIEQARPYMDKNIGAIVGGDIQAREQSIVLYPAIEGADIGTEFSFDDSTQDMIEAIEQAKVIEETEHNDQYVIGLAIQIVENRSNSVVLDRDVYQATVEELEVLRVQNDRNKKLLWLLGETDRDFSEEMIQKIDEFNMSQLKALFDIYSDMRGRLSTMRATIADDDPTVSAKEDVREMIFGLRKDSKKVGKIRGLQNLR